MPQRAKTRVPPSAQDDTTETVQQDERMKTVQQAATYASEAFVPGASNFLKGDLKQGSIHAVAGFVGARFFGPIGWVLAIADSLAVSQTGKHLHEHLGLFTKSAESAPASQA